MPKSRIQKSDGVVKVRPGVELGLVLRRLMRNPPYLKPPRAIGFYWVPKTLAPEIGSTDSAVRQWLRGVALPQQFLPDIIRVIFGPDRDDFSSQIKELQDAFQLGLDIRDGRKTRTIKPDDRSSASIPDLTPHFIGRDDEVAALANALVAPGQIAVLVQGGPGMGKTELTKAVAHHETVEACFGECRWFIALDAATDARKLLDAISGGIGTDPNLGLGGILVRLGSAPSLLILDNLETPWEPEQNGAAVQEILHALCEAVDLTLMASIRGDRIPEGVDWSDVHHADALTPKYAASLFSRLAHFKNTTDPFFRRFINALGGVPLAITLVALRARGSASLQRLWSEWERIGAELATQRGGDKTRHTSLIASIRLSLDSPLIDKRSQRLFSVLGRLPDGISEQERNSIAEADSFECERALLDVGLAIEQSGRVSLLPPIREYASSLYLSDDDNLLWADAILELLRFIDAHPPCSYEMSTAQFKKIGVSLGNLEAALGMLVAMGNIQKIDNLFDALIVVARRFRLSTDIVLRIDDYVENLEQQPSYYKSRLLVAIMAERANHNKLAEVSYRLALLKINPDDAYALTYAHLLYGEFENRNIRHRGRENLVQARKMAEIAQDRLSENNANLALASASVMDSSFRSARQVVEECANYYNKNELWIKSAECSELLAKIYSLHSLNDGAINHINYAIATWEENGFDRKRADCLVFKAELLFNRMYNENAREIIEDALEIYKISGDERGIASCTYRIGTIIYYSSGNVMQALSQIEESERIYQKYGDQLGLGKCTYFRAALAKTTSQPNEYKALIESAHDQFRDAQNSCERAQCVYDLACIAYEQGRAEEAFWKVTEAIKIFDERGDPLGWMNSQILMARMLLDVPAFEKAEVLASAVLDMSREFDSEFHEAQSLSILAEIFSNLQRHAEARAAWKRASVIFEKLGMVDDQRVCLDRLAI